jgi:thioesterase domain-containing protein
MAHQLRQQGEEVSALVLIDSDAPPPLQDEYEEIAQYATLLTELAYTAGKTVSDPKNDADFVAQLRQILKPLSNLERQQYIWSLGQERQLLPPNLTFEHMEQLFFPYKTNYLATRQYVAPVVADQRILLFKASETRHKNEEETLGWQSLSREPLQVSTLPCNHVTILQPPAVETLARQLQTLL